MAWLSAIGGCLEVRPVTFRIVACRWIMRLTDERLIGQGDERSGLVEEVFLAALIGGLVAPLYNAIGLVSDWIRPADA